METCDVAIIGAGPYGLSAAAHLRTIKGLDVRVFGEPMSFWEEHMPAGMLLRSPFEGSHISDPDSSLNLHSFGAAHPGSLNKPVSLESFVAYGKWFHRQAVPCVDRRKILGIRPVPQGFRLTLNDGETVRASRVVIATGILFYARRPPEFDGLPSDLVSHTCVHRDLSRFTGKQVLVLGGGQSSLESAALLYEAGALPEVIMRKPTLSWAWNRPWLHKEPFASLLYAPADVGPAGYSHIIARPGLFVHLPRKTQDRLAERTAPAGGAPWLKPRLQNVHIEMGRTIKSAVPVGEQLNVTLDDGQTRQVDHLLLGTGYRVDIARTPFLDTDVLRSIAQHEGSPQLGRGFESSVPGLHFIGATAAWSFGPLMRFVAGTGFAARTLAAHLKKSCASKTKPRAMRSQPVVEREEEAVSV